MVRSQIYSVVTIAFVTQDFIAFIQLCMVLYSAHTPFSHRILFAEYSRIVLLGMEYTSIYIDMCAQSHLRIRRQHGVPRTE
jgi:hypothetical protein